MTSSFEPESVDLAAVASVLQSVCGSAVEGDVVGRTRMRDEVAKHLGCSQLEAETVVETMIGRGFLERREEPSGRVVWSVRA